MKRFILTGTPGSGKTAILRQFEMDGFGVVEEAATDVIALLQARGIAEPWTEPSFIDAVVKLQEQRVARADKVHDALQFHDRSVVCTAALAAYLGYPRSRALERAMERIARDKTFETDVFFVRNLGFVAPTEARRISYEEALRFERIHEEVYEECGFRLISLDPGTVEERVAKLRSITQSV
jgi:predicted ATPase